MLFYYKWSKPCKLLRMHNEFYTSYVKWISMSNSARGTGEPLLIGSEASCIIMGQASLLSHCGSSRITRRKEREGERERECVTERERERFNLYPRSQQWGMTESGKNNPLGWGMEGVRRERADQVTQGCPGPPTSYSSDWQHNQVTLNHPESSSPSHTHQHPWVPCREFSAWVWTILNRA